MSDLTDRVRKIQVVMENGVPDSAALATLVGIVLDLAALVESDRAARAQQDEWEQNANDRRSEIQERSRASQERRLREAEQLARDAEDRAYAVERKQREADERARRAW